MSDPHPPLPVADGPDDLTPEWLTRALDQSGVLRGATIAAVEITPLGTGQMSDSVRIALRYRDDEFAALAPATIVAKQAAADPTSRRTATMLRSYEKEVRFYTEIAPTLRIRVPTIHHAAITDDASSFVLLQEDLAPAVQGDQLAGCSVDVAELAIDELVGLHAPRWGDDAVYDHPWLTGPRPAPRPPSTSPGPIAPREADSSGGMLPALWTGFTERYADRIDDNVRATGQLLFGNLARYHGAGNAPRTVVHGDYRLDNLLIDESARTVTVVDWQTCAFGQAMADVAYFIGAGLLEETRREHEERLVRRYHDALTEAGVVLAWDDCWRGYRQGTWSGLLMAVGASMMVQRTERGDDMFMAMASRHAAHIVDMDAAAL